MPLVVDRDSRGPSTEKRRPLWIVHAGRTYSHRSKVTYPVLVGALGSSGVTM